jgi:transposase
MNKRLSVEGHQSVEDLAERYRQARAGVERSQWQIIWLAAPGRTWQEVAALTGYSVPWGRKRIQRSNRQGPAGIGDRRQHHPGQSGLLTKEQQAELAQAQPARIHAETLFQWWPTTACLEETTGVHPDVA